MKLLMEQRLATVQKEIKGMPTNFVKSEMNQLISELFSVTLVALFCVLACLLVALNVKCVLLTEHKEAKIKTHGGVSCGQGGRCVTPRVY